jgi:hypothetical protein
MTRCEGLLPTYARNLLWTVAAAPGRAEVHDGFWAVVRDLGDERLNAPHVLIDMRPATSDGQPKLAAFVR